MHEQQIDGLTNSPGAVAPGPVKAAHTPAVPQKLAPATTPPSRNPIQVEYQD